MGRKRMTWQRGNSRRASAPPATPGFDDAGYKHPANQTPDPDPDQYENGDTSSWAEDVHPPPYQNSPHPAIPTESGGYNHPAGNPANLKQAMYRKAHKCIRIAQAMLGAKATVSQIENQALSMLDWPERKVKASLQRIASTRRRQACGEMGMYGMEDDMGMGVNVSLGMEDEDDMGMFGMDDEGMFDEDDMLYGMDDEDDEGMDELDEFDEFDDDMDDMYGMLADYEQLDPVMGPQRMASKEDRMLAEMLREKKAAKADPMARFAGLDPEEKRMLADMLRQAADEDEDKDDDEDEGKKAADDKDDDKDADDDKDEGAKDKKAADDDDDADDKDTDDKDDDNDADDDKDDADDADDDADDDEGAKGKKAHDDDLDPMGMMDDPMDRLAAAGEDEELRALFENDLFAAAARVAAEEGDEDDDEGQDEDEGASKKARRTAAQRPRPRKPAREGSPRRLGNVHTAGGRSEVDELSQLWTSAPDVSEAFGITETNMDVE